MQVSEKLVRAFQETYERKFGENISAEKARQDLSDLAELVKIIMQKRK